MSGGITAAVIGGGALIYSASQSSKAAKSAAQTQADAADRATAAQQEGLNQQLAAGAPYVDKGTAAMNQLSALTMPGGELYESKFTPSTYTPDQFTYDQFTDPGAAFRLKEGMKAMNATAAARGGLISGNALRAGQAYGQELGSQEYQNAFNRYLANTQNQFAASQANNQNLFAAYQANRQNKLSPLQFLTSVGQGAAAGQAANIGNFANASAANTMGAANAQAAGQIGSANAYTNAIGQGVNAYQMNQLINRSSYGRPTTTNFYGTNSYLSSPGYSGMNQELGLSD
jgi:hypothetical protein